MKKVFLLIGALIGFFAHAQELSFIDRESSIEFQIKNFGLAVDGSFSGLTGTINFDPATPENNSFLATVSAASVDTGIDLRDKHLRKQDYFNSNNFPEIKFQSEKVVAIGKDSWMVTGLLTIKKTSQRISFPFQVQLIANGFVFHGQFKIDRRDFEVGGNNLSLSDAVLVKLKLKTESKAKL